MVINYIFLSKNLKLVTKVTILNSANANTVIHNTGISLSSSVDVMSGGALCPYNSVEFTCVATGVTFINWQANNRRIAGFNAGQQHAQEFSPPYTVFLDEVNVDMMTELANMTSRIVVNMSDLVTGVQLSCSQLSIKRVLNISYVIRGTYSYVATCLWVKFVMIKLVVT